MRHFISQHNFFFEISLSHPLSLCVFTFPVCARRVRWMMSAIYFATLVPIFASRNTDTCPPISIALLRPFAPPLPLPNMKYAINAKRMMFQIENMGAGAAAFLCAPPAAPGPLLTISPFSFPLVPSTSPRILTTHTSFPAASFSHFPRLLSPIAFAPSPALLRAI